MRTQRKTLAILAGLLLSGLLLSGSAARAQQKSKLSGFVYDTAQETAISGTVASYTAASTTAPIGAHVMLQTAAGAVDVHLGPASYLQANQFSLASGDGLKVIGLSMPTNNGSVFLARIVQKGGQSLAVRSSRGFLLATGGARALPAARRAQLTQQGAPR